MTNYFAYGSLLSEREIKKTCPNYIEVGIGYIENYKLAFTRKSTGRWKPGGVADIVQSEGARVWGIVYKISAKDESELDTREGFKRDHPTTGAYIKINVEVRVGHETKYAMTYSVREKQLKHVPPKREYLDLIVAGAKSRDFPALYQKALTEAATLVE